MAKAKNDPTPPVTVEAAAIPAPEVPPVVSVPVQPGPSMLTTGPQPAYPVMPPGSAGVPPMLGFAPVGWIPPPEMIARDFQFIRETHGPVGARGAEFGTSMADLEQRQRADAERRLNPGVPEGEDPAAITARFEQAAKEREDAGDQAGAAELRAQGRSLANQIATRAEYDAREAARERQELRNRLNRLRNLRTPAAPTGLEGGYLREGRRGLGLPPDEPADDPDHRDLWQTVVATFHLLASGGDLTRGSYRVLSRHVFSKLVAQYPSLDPERAEIARLEALLAPPVTLNPEAA